MDDRWHFELRYHLFHNTLRAPDGSLPTTHSVVCVPVLTVKKKKWVLFVISAWASPPDPKEWVPFPSPSSLKLPSWTLTLFRICLGRHGRKDCKLALCSRTAAAGSLSPEPKLSLAPPHLCPPFVGLYLLSLARQPSPHPVSPISDPLRYSLWNTLRIERAYKNHWFIWKIFLDDLSPCWSLPSWNPLRLAA